MANTKDNKNLNVPNLRFPEFEGEWEKHKLSDYSSKITKKNKTNSVKNVLCNSANFGIIPQSDYFDRDIANSDNTIGYYVISKGDFVYNPRKSTVAPYGPINIYDGTSCGIISPLYLCFSIKNIFPEFLYYRFKSNVWYPFIYSHGDTGVRFDRVSIKDDTFFDMPIFTPTLQEQQRIAKLLDLINERISTQNKIIEELKELKSAVGRTLLFNPTWKEYQIKDIANTIGGGTPSSSNQSYWTGNIPWVSSSDIKEDNINEISISRYISEEAIANSATKTCTPPFILIVSRVGVGKVAISQSLLCTSQDFCNLIDIKCNVVFLAYKLAFIMRRKAKDVQGTSIKGITTEEILKIKVGIPNTDEQNKIAAYLMKIDQLIVIQDELSEYFKQQKRYLLHQMFI